MPESWESPAVIAHTQTLLYSFQQWFGQPLLLCHNSPELAAQQLYLAPVVVLSHGCEPDPILNYGNQKALDLWAMDWPTFTAMPSRLTAEPAVREGRSQLLTTAKQQGYLTNYEGIRISRTGRRFLIQQAIIWKVFDAAGQVYGQAATFEHWKHLP